MSEFARAVPGALVVALLKSAAWGYVILPRFVRELLARALGAALWAIGFRRAVIDQNLQLAFRGEGSRNERARLTRAAYRHLGFLIWEILAVFAPLAWVVRRRGRLEGLEHWQAARAQERGVIFLSSHVGNWEWMAATGAAHGIDILLVTKLLKPAWLHRAIEAGRARAGVRGTYEPQTFRDVLGHLKRAGTVGLVLDQYTGPPVGIRVPFFGQPVGTHSVVATLAKRTGAPVLPVVNYRDAEGRIVVRIGKPLVWKTNSERPALEIAENTAIYTAQIESDVREFPEQWLWTHRRFKGDLSPLRPDEWLEKRKSHR